LPRRRRCLLQTAAPSWRSWAARSAHRGGGPAPPRCCSRTRRVRRWSSTPPRRQVVVSTTASGVSFRIRVPKSIVIASPFATL
jgi:hypothetical protein